MLGVSFPMSGAAAELVLASDHSCLWAPQPKTADTQLADPSGGCFRSSGPPSED